MEDRTTRVLKAIVGYGGAFLLGVLPAFFVIFNFLFTDIFTFTDRLLTYVIAAVVYLMFGAVIGVIAPRRPVWPALVFAAPAVVIVIPFIVFAEGVSLLPIASGYVPVVLISLLLGALGAARLRNRRGHP